METGGLADEKRDRLQKELSAVLLAYVGWLNTKPTIAPHIRLRPTAETNFERSLRETYLREAQSKGSGRTRPCRHYCEAGARDGTCCADDTCDIESNVR